MAHYVCTVCEYLYDEEKKGEAWSQLADDWLCPACESPKSRYELLDEETAAIATADQDDHQPGDPCTEFRRDSDALETHMADIHQMAEMGESIIEPLRTRAPTFAGTTS